MLSFIQTAAVKAQSAALSLVARARREEGQGMVEYALILVLIAIVVIVILAIVGSRVSDVFSNINNGLGTS